MDGTRGLKRNVMVFDATGKVIEPTTPNVAVKLLHKKKAEIVANEPFSIQFVNPLKSLQGKGTIMRIQDYLDQSRIYIQNLSNTNLVLDFEHDGQRASKSLPAGVRDPICLSSVIPPQMIRSSVSFSSFISRAMNRRPPIARLLTEKEYDEYFNRKSVATGKPVEALMAEAEAQIAKREQKIIEATPEAQGIDASPSASAPAPAPGATSQIIMNGETVTLDAAGVQIPSASDVNTPAEGGSGVTVSPRVQQICLAAKKNPDAPDMKPMSTKEVTNQFNLISDSLTLADIDFAMSQLSAVSITNWLRMKRESLLKAQT